MASLAPPSIAITAADRSSSSSSALGPPPPLATTSSAGAAVAPAAAATTSELPSYPTPAPTLVPLTLSSVVDAHRVIKPYVHETPVLTCRTIDELASTPQTADALRDTPWTGQTPARPRFRFFFKCENFQKGGAFKIRGATHAVSRLSPQELRNGVMTHSSGNHAQALALAARSKGVRAHIVMPTISTPSKIAATRGYGAEVTFSGSTEPERAAVAARVQRETGATFVPPYDHAHIVCGQGTLGLELEDQVADIIEEDPARSAHGRVRSRRGSAAAAASHHQTDSNPVSPTSTTASSAVQSPPPKAWPMNKHTPGSLDAVIAPLGGGGMLSGVALAFGESRTWIFGAEPSHDGGDDGRRGLAQGKRIESVSTLTIADGLRTPVGSVPWHVISDPNYVRAVYSVTDQQIKSAMRLVLERLKLMIEPSAAVGLAVALYDEEFRRIVELEGGQDGWDVGVVLSGGNTTVEAIARLFAEDGKEGDEKESQRTEEEVRKNTLDSLGR